MSQVQSVGWDPAKGRGLESTQKTFSNRQLCLLKQYGDIRLTNEVPKTLWAKVLLSPGCRVENKTVFITEGWDSSPWEDSSSVLGEWIKFDLASTWSLKWQTDELVTVLLLWQTLQKTTQRERIVLLTISDAQSIMERGQGGEQQLLHGGRGWGERKTERFSFLFYSVWIPRLKKVPPTSGGSSPFVNPETPSRTQLPETCFPNLLYTSPSNQVDNQEKETVK